MRADRRAFRIRSWRLVDSAAPSRFQKNCATRTGIIAGRIGNFDASPEKELGDISGLKDYANDDDQIGSDVINTLIKAHAYWMRQADVDGFRWMPLNTWGRWPARVSVRISGNMLTV